MAEKAAVLGWDRSEEGDAGETSAVAELRPASPPQTVQGPELRKRRRKGKGPAVVVKQVETAPPVEEEQEDEEDTPLIRMKKLRVSTPAVTESQRVEDEGVGEAQAAEKFGLPAAIEDDDVATGTTGQELVEYTGGSIGEGQEAERSVLPIKVLVSEDVEMREPEVMEQETVPPSAERRVGEVVSEMGGTSASVPPQEATGGDSETFVVPPWRLPPGFGVLGQFKDRAKNYRARLDWLTGAASASDLEKLRRGPDEAFYHWYLRNTVQVPLVNAEMLCRVMEKDRVLAEQREALAKAVEENKRLKANNIALVEAVREMSDKLKASSVDMAKEKADREASEAALRGEISNLSSHHAEAQQEIKEEKEKNAALRAQISSVESENVSLKKVNEDSQLLIKKMIEENQVLIEGHEAKLAEMKAVISKNRSRRQELQQSLVKEKVYYAENVFKTKGFEDAVGDVVLEWYDGGFDVARKQAEEAMDKGETEVDWDGERTMGVELPKIINFPTTCIPVRPADEKPPTVLLEEWEAAAGDDMYAEEELAPAT